MRSVIVLKPHHTVLVFDEYIHHQGLDKSGTNSDILIALTSNAEKRVKR